MTGILELALQQGIWAALYIYLFFRMLKENANREAQYQQIIASLGGSIQEGIEDIQKKLDWLTGESRPESSASEARNQA